MTPCFYELARQAGEVLMMMFIRAIALKYHFLEPFSISSAFKCIKNRHFRRFYRKSMVEMDPREKHSGKTGWKNFEKHNETVTFLMRLPCDVHRMLLAMPALSHTIGWRETLPLLTSPLPS